MSIHRQAAKRDANEKEIVDALELAGAFVIRLSGEDIPDLLVVYKGVKYFLEVKNPDAGGKVKAGQKKLHEALGEVHVVWNVSEALAAIGAGVAAPVTIANVMIRFPNVCFKLSNGATYSHHLLTYPVLAKATDKQRKDRLVWPNKVEWPSLKLVIRIDEIRKG